jgi:hypothetical protein
MTCQAFCDYFLPSQDFFTQVRHYLSYFWRKKGEARMQRDQSILRSGLPGFSFAAPKTENRLTSIYNLSSIL